MKQTNDELKAEIDLIEKEVERQVVAFGSFAYWVFYHVSSRSLLSKRELSYVINLILLFCLICVTDFRLRTSENELKALVEKQGEHGS